GPTDPVRPPTLRPSRPTPVVAGLPTVPSRSPLWRSADRVTVDCESDENDMRCATGTPGLMAQVNAQAKAQVIFSRTSVASEMTRKSFCQLRKSFCLHAQVICLHAQAIFALGR